MVSFNGNSPKSILYNGLTVLRVVYNGSEVWTATTSGGVTNNTAVASVESSKTEVSAEGEV